MHVISINNCQKLLIRFNFRKNANHEKNGTELNNIFYINYIFQHSFFYIKILNTSNIQVQGIVV